MAAQHIYIPLVCGVAVLVFYGSGAVCAPLCLEGDFDSQLQQILRAQMLSAQDPSVTQALGDVRATLDQRWQDYELVLTGSLAIGLATIASDIDLAIHLPNSNSSAGLYVLQETEQLFKKQPELYSEMKHRHNVGYNSSFFQFYHIPSERYVEIEFQTGDLDIFKANLLKYYFDLDRKFKPLTIFLKYWFNIHEISGHHPGSLPYYALYMLVIFYLQQKNLAPPGYILQVNSKTHFIDDWDLDFIKLPYSTSNTENLHQLLGGFFKYYSEFDFEENVVSPFAGLPIPKNAFTDVNNFTLYHNTWNRAMLQEAMCAEMSIQDIVGLRMNTAIKMSHEQASKFKYLMKPVATMFDKLPSDKILSAILDFQTILSTIE
ncbi:hypothetical protein PYW08_012040 [Mythimna loreyi]|uniref:Uncharacterized protein n=1 Tax=Mythimna loreyi TaxID=667449 RepID=A0ACC2QL41_9NEOP|nr:hypothetical protein PYW08_012040 [Mythimna loreyi]